MCSCVSVVESHEVIIVYCEVIVEYCKVIAEYCKVVIGYCKVTVIYPNLIFSTNERCITTRVKKEETKGAILFFVQYLLNWIKSFNMATYLYF